MEIVHPSGMVIGDVERLAGPLEKVRGLMLRPEGSRALLAFGNQDFHGIWMFLMRYSLDVAFLDEGREIVSIRKDVPPAGLHPSTWKVYRPPKMCRYILEVESGLLDEKGFERGDRVTFRG